MGRASSLLTPVVLLYRWAGRRAPIIRGALPLPASCRGRYILCMDPGLLGPLVPIAAIIAYAAVKIARLRVAASGSASPEITARLEALEHTVQDVQHELAETQERLDFAERLLGQAREDRRIGG